MRFVAFDASPDLIDDLRDGTIDALVAQNPFQIGYEAVKSLANDLRGQKPAKLIDLSARVITRQDLDKPEIKAILFPNLSKYLN